METIASFNKIFEQLQNEITASKSCILIAVAWFTNKDLLGLLVDKVKVGVQVKIIVSDDIVNKRLNFNEFVKIGGDYQIIQSYQDKFMHNKFAIFDNKKVITGSYNWTYSAEYNNLESVIISRDENLIKQFNIRFKQLFEKSVPPNKLTTKLLIDSGADKSEKEFVELENELKEDLLKAWEESGKIDKKLQNKFIIDFIENYGAIGACKRLMSTGLERIQNGFIKMWELNRIDLTFESIIVKNKYKNLLDDKTITLATERLKKFQKST
ncbi:MAG TPA: phospholipase D-like domain-containing protein [Bacteroidales bacterium]|nr:phospholipase D-like domain-containing protein [Bacteroidales bacterium]